MKIVIEEVNGIFKLTKEEESHTSFELYDSLEHVLLHLSLKTSKYRFLRLQDVDQKHCLSVYNKALAQISEEINYLLAEFYGNNNTRWEGK